MFFSDASPVVLLVLMLPAIINLWAIWHAMRNTFPVEKEKMLWVLAGIFLPVIGGILYLLFGLRRCQKNK